MTQPALFAPPSYIEHPLVNAEPLKLWPTWAFRVDGANLHDGDVWRGWLESLRPLLDQHQFRAHGQTIPMPRLEAFFGPEGSTYPYSGNSYPAKPMSVWLAALMERVNAACDHTFNAVFVNLYRNDRDSIGWHSDAQDVLGPAEDIVIGSLSFGETRRFRLKLKDDARIANTPTTWNGDLHDGDLLRMGRGVQRWYVHEAPKDTVPCGERWNLTFRRLVP